MFKKNFLAVFLVAVIAGGLAGIKALQIKKMISQGESFVMPPAVVSTAGFFVVCRWGRRIKSSQSSR